jgi:hypothetical protein
VTSRELEAAMAKCGSKCGTAKKATTQKKKAAK